MWAAAFFTRCLQSQDINLKLGLHCTILCRVCWAVRESVSVNSVVRARARPRVFLLCTRFPASSTARAVSDYHLSQPIELFLFQCIFTDHINNEYRESARSSAYIKLTNTPVIPLYIAQVNTYKHIRLFKLSKVSQYCPANSFEWVWLVCSQEVEENSSSL